MTSVLSATSLLATTGRVAIAAALILFVARLCRRPTGRFGRGVLRSMNARHGAVTAWGLSHVPIGAGLTILDVGCGGGRTIGRLASMSPGSRVLGIDSSPDSVAVARETNQELIEQGRVDVQLGTVSRLPHPDATFDLVTAVETHYYWPDLARDLAEVKRVLKPGGRVLIIAETYRGRRNDWLYRPVMTLLLRATYLTADQHEQVLVAAGYTNTQVFVERRNGWIALTGTRPI